MKLYGKADFVKSRIFLTPALSQWERGYTLRPQSPLSPRDRIRVRAFFASGGLKDGLDIAKCIALGASLGGMTGQFLKAAAISNEKTVEMMKLMKRQIEARMLATSSRKTNTLAGN